MTPEFTEKDFEQAIDECASEPVHIPGIVQPFGCLIAVNVETGKIDYVSENCRAIIGKTVSDLLKSDIHDTFAPEIVHALNNAASLSGFGNKLTQIGLFELDGCEVEISGFRSGEHNILQLERAKDPQLGDGDALNLLSFLMSEIQSCDDQSSLFNLTTKLLRHLTGYDRVMIYKFDNQFNGEVIAEERQKTLEPFVGLRFPHWDIPAQAREIMCKIPLRFIQDVDLAPVNLKASNTALPPLDITYAECRGVAEIHMEYLRNMGSKSTLTLSIVVEGDLWGIISFHNRRPRVPPSKQRQLLTAFLGLFCTKLTALRKQSQLDLVQRIDGVKDSYIDEIGTDTTMEGSLPRIGPVIIDILQANGVALQNDGQIMSYGCVPEPAVVERLLQDAQAKVGAPIVVENMKSHYPEFKGSLNDCAGVLASALTQDRALCIFRGEAIEQVSWAGNPDKKIDVASGKYRLTPRSSFSKYLEDIKGYSAPWRDEDVYFAERLWVLVNSAERRSLINNLNRQQLLMIDELNHRVRNILALVRSVSRQARRHYGSLESYSASIESRIKALAAAHDIASGSSVSAVSCRELVSVELAPYEKEGETHVIGSDRLLRADIAPIFSLVIHELATNAAKYGALSDVNGSVEVKISDVQGGLLINWREIGGPEVSPPNDFGFGSTLIEKAIPHEMGGVSNLRFERTGVEADFFLPDDILENEPHAETAVERVAGRIKLSEPALPFDPKAFEGMVLLLEDNFVIATDLEDQLLASGVKNVEIFSNVVDALEVLTTDRPEFAFLDINLGPGKTSQPVALKLVEEGVPFVFVTGYGDKIDLPVELQDVPRLTKPVATAEIEEAMMRLAKLKPPGN